MICGYTRVSSLDQNTERQLHGEMMHKLFTDKASGKDVHRPQLQAALSYMREGDTLLVHSPDRLARNAQDLLRIVRELNTKGVTVQFTKNRLCFTGDSKDPMATLMVTMLAAFAEFERSLIRERQREGIAAARAKGVYKGRKRSLTAEQVAELRAKAAAPGAVKAQLAREYRISRETLYQYIR